MFVYTLHTNVHAHAPFGRLVKRSDGENNRTAGSKPKCSMNPVNVDSIPIWVVAYPQDALRQKIGGQRLRAQLPPVPDLQRLLQAAGVHGKLNANTEISTVHGAYLVGLARVRPGASGEFELQDDIMHSYFRAPGCSVVVEEFAALNISPPVRVNLCRFESQYPAVPWHRHKIGPFLSTDDWSSVMVEWQGQQVQAREVLRRWGRVADIESIRVVPVVEQIGLLLRARLWRRVFIPSHWKLPYKSLAESWRGVWPPAAQVEPDYPKMSKLATYKMVADVLRALHRPRYRQQGLDDEMWDDVGEALARIQTLVHEEEAGWLERKGDFFYSNGRWSGSACLSVALVTYECSMGMFEYIASVAARSLALDDEAATTSIALARSRHGGFLGPAGLGIQNWCQQLLDIAFMLHWRRFLASNIGQFSLFWYAESSTQRNYEWMNTNYMMVS